MSADEGLQIGRRVKARRIAAMIRGLGGTAEDATKLTDQEWKDLDKVSRTASSRVTMPPSAETRALVLEYLSRPDGAPRDEDVPPA